MVLGALIITVLIALVPGGGIIIELAAPFGLAFIIKSMWRNAAYFVKAKKPPYSKGVKTMNIDQNGMQQVVDEASNKAAGNPR